MKLVRPAIGAACACAVALSFGTAVALDGGASGSIDSSGESATVVAQGNVAQTAQQVDGAATYGVLALDTASTVSLAALQSDAQMDPQDVAAEAIMQSSTASLLDTSLTVDCGNGWVLAYSDEGTTVTITGVATTGSGKLTIPATVNGKNVTVIAAKAFMRAELSEVYVPEGVTSIGQRAFCVSTITSISLPSTLDHVTQYCFALCPSLANVEFRGSTLGYLDVGAFYKCTALTSIELPLLTRYPTNAEATADGVTNCAWSSAVGYHCFEGSSNLTTIILDGPVTQDVKKYFVDPNCMPSQDKENPQVTMICKCGTQLVTSGTGMTTYGLTNNYYYTLDFYNSEEDAADLQNRVASSTYHCVARTDSGSYDYMLRLVPLLNGSFDANAYLLDGTDDLPACPEGKVWGVYKATPDSAYDYFLNSRQIVPVDRENLDYGWVGSPTIDAFNGAYTGESSYFGNDDDPTFELDLNGNVAELSEVCAYAADGSKLDSSAYTLEYQKGVYTYEYGARGYSLTFDHWEDIDVSQITTEGHYQVRAVGTGDYANTVTDYVEFDVAIPEPEVTVYNKTSSPSTYLGDVVDKACVALGYTPDGPSPAYNVVLPAGKWTNQLVGAGLAAAGGGIMLYDCGATTESDAAGLGRMMVGAMQSGTNGYIDVGNHTDVPQSDSASDNVYLADRVAQRTGYYGTRFGENTTTAQELATSILTSFKYRNWEALWGSTVVIASPSDDQQLRTQAAAQYVYQKRARVMFLKDDGTLSDEDLSVLAGSSVRSVTLVGDTTCVSQGVEDLVAARTGKTPERILEDADACQATLDLAAQLVAAGTNNYRNIVVADATGDYGAANVSSASLYAASTDGVVISCASESEAETIRTFMADLIHDQGLLAMSKVTMVGEFSYLEDPVTYFESAWKSSDEE